ncbi:MAG TPA: neutral/alkaline non-lysosomal ceramidase N-terminal domain-containing protein [Flavitalea sp.]|nr:neutral/alkaline non-lysosomal ceramidase N-terminal domain-containing protein [Flavitalea sp.]
MNYDRLLTSVYKHSISYNCKSGIMRCMVLFLLACCLVNSLKAQGGFRAAVVKVDITPESPQMMAGYGARKLKSAGVHDHIFHRIVVLDNGVTQFILISSDLGKYSPSVYDQVEAQLQKQYGIDPLNVWWSYTHTHAAPQVGPPSLSGISSPENKNYVDDEYTVFLKRKLIEGIVEARGKLVAARLGTGWGFSQANINRRAVDIDGKATIGLNPDGPVDRRIGMIRIDKEDGTPLVLIVNYPIHGTVMGAENLDISGDAPGIVSAYVEEKIGAPVLFINGAAGDLAPIYSVYPSAKAGHLGEFRVLLGDKILEANKKISATEGAVTLTTGALTVETPRKAGHDEWPADLGKYTKDNKAGVHMVLLPVRFLKINDDIAIWSAPLELFCEISNEVRDRSPFPYTFYFGYTNGHMRYLPTEAAFKQGGYETDVSPFSPSAARDLTESVVGYLQGEMKTERSNRVQSKQRK